MEEKEVGSHSAVVRTAGEISQKTRSEKQDLLNLKLNNRILTRSCSGHEVLLYLELQMLST